MRKHLRDPKNSSTFAPAFDEKVRSRLCSLTRKTCFFAVKEEESRQPKSTQLISLLQTHLSMKAGYNILCKIKKRNSFFFFIEEE